jgi:uncharacterized iron-regulated membrane protein
MAVRPEPKGQATAGVRKKLFRWHQWIGATIAAMLIVIAATGLVLTFRGQLRAPKVVAPEIAVPLRIDQMYARAEQEAGGEAITDIALPQDPCDPWVFYLDDDAETELFFAGDGSLITRRTAGAGLTRLLFQLHTGEIAGIAGQAVVLAAGTGLIALVASGLGMMYTRRRRRK